jgi:glycosyltransferase
VLVVTRNRAALLRRTLEGVLADDYPHKEVVVVDGASKDGTVDLLRSHGDRITRWISEPDRCEYEAWNKAIGLATGDIIKFVPDDDELRPGVLGLGARWLAAHPDIDIVFGQTAVWDDGPGGATLRYVTQAKEPRFHTSDWLRHSTGVQSIAAFVRRRVFDRIGLFDTAFRAGDTEFWLRASRAGVRFGLLPEVVADYHVTGGNGIVRLKPALARDVLRLALRHGTLDDLRFVTRVWGTQALGLDRWTVPAAAAVRSAAARAGLRRRQKPAAP